MDHNHPNLCFRMTMTTVKANASLLLLAVVVLSSPSFGWIVSPQTVPQKRYSSKDISFSSFSTARQATASSTSTFTTDVTNQEDENARRSSDTDNYLSWLSERSSSSAPATNPTRLSSLSPLTPTLTTPNTESAGSSGSDSSFWISVHDAMQHMAVVPSNKMETEFGNRYVVDAEAWTSCDNSENESNGCTLGPNGVFEPTKWMHLREEHERIIQSPTVTNKGKEEVMTQEPLLNLSYPTSTSTASDTAAAAAALSQADTVTKETMEWCDAFVSSELSAPVNAATASVPRATSNRRTNRSKENVRVKVVPASFGLDCFENVVLEASKELLHNQKSPCSSSSAQRHRRYQQEQQRDSDATTATAGPPPLPPITFVVAVPDCDSKNTANSYVGATEEEENVLLFSDFESFLGLTEYLEERLILQDEDDQLHFSGADATMMPFHPNATDVCSLNEELDLEDDDDYCFPPERRSPYPTVMLVRTSDL